MAERRATVSWELLDDGTSAMAMVMGTPWPAKRSASCAMGWRCPRTIHVYSTTTLPIRCMRNCGCGNESVMIYEHLCVPLLAPLLNSSSQQLKSDADHALRNLVDYERRLGL